MEIIQDFLMINAGFPGDFPHGDTGNRLFHAAFMEYGKGMGNFGAGVEYSFDTIFGPFSANIHWSDFTGKVGMYLSAGFNF